MESITCPTPGCGFQLTRAHLSIMEQWGPQMALVEGACPRCGACWGPIALPQAVWERLALGEIEETASGARMGDEPITSDEMLEFYQYLERLQALPGDADLPTPDQLLRFVRSVIRDGMPDPLMEELRCHLETRWPQSSLSAALEPLLLEATAAIERQAGRLSPASRLRELLAILGVEPPRERRDFHEVVRHQMRTVFLFGLLLGLGVVGELDDFVQRWQEERTQGRNV